MARPGSSSPTCRYPKTGRHLGNYPQAFTHLALINAVMHVIGADQEIAHKQSPWAEVD